MFTRVEDILDAVLNQNDDAANIPKYHNCRVTLTPVGVPLVEPIAHYKHDNSYSTDIFCKVCRRAQATFVNLPCSHLTVCDSCIQNNCVICNNVIEEKIKVYL